MDDLLILLIISMLINFVAFFEFWVFWIMAVKQYEGLRNYLKRGRGFGYAILRYPEGRITKKFVKLNKETIQIDKKNYYISSERIYRFENMPTLFYNAGYAMPLRFENMIKDELWNNAEFLNNIVLNVKAAAEAEAEAKNSLKEMLLFIACGIGLLCLGGIAYLIYILTAGGNSGGVIVAQP